jgi:LuxR family maltose regulon positive regulatory protein
MDFLREKQGELPPGEVRELYTRAAEWCLKNKLRLDAAANYARAGDCRGLLAVVDTLPRIPPTKVTSFLLDNLDRMIAARPGPDKEDEDEGFLFLRYIVRAKLLMCLGRFEESATESRKAIARFEALPPGPTRSRILSAAYNNLGTLVLLTCRYTRDYNCLPYFERGYHYYRENPEPPRGQTGQSNLSSYILQVGYPAEPGEIERAINTVAPAIPYASESLNGYLQGADFLARAELAYYQGDLNRAEKFARQGAYQGREKNQYEVENRSLFYLMRIGIHRGSAAGIRELQRRLEAQLEIPEYLSRYTIHDIGMGRFYAQIGLTGKIAPWLRNDFEEGELNALFHNFNILVRAWCLFAEKNYSGVLRVLGPEENRRDLESFLLGKLEIRVLEAAARFHLGEEEQALGILEQAWEMAAPNSLDMPFIELGEDMRLLAGAALARLSPKDEEYKPQSRKREEKKGESRIPRLWLKTISSRASAYGKKISLAAEQYRQGEQERGKPPVYLTYRERRVLAGLARGLKREGIAAETGLSLNTVKGTIGGIYGKLGAVNRADAIRIAADLRILTIF